MLKVSEGTDSLTKKIVTQNSNPSFSSILSGIAHGDIWINDVENPTLALVYSIPVGGYRIMGAFKSGMECFAFVSFLEQELFPRLKAEGIDEFEFAVDDPTVERLLLSHLGKYKVIADQELTYIKTPDKITDSSCKFRETDGYMFTEVNDECFTHKYINKNFMMSRIMDSWGSTYSFIKYGKAFIAVDKNEIVAMILGSAYYDNLLAIDIATQPNHRKRGIATTLTNLLISYCKEADITAFWNCTSDNISSQSVAKRTGFTYAGVNDYHYFSII